MKKFLLLLILIFVFFYIGGALLFDTGMSYSIAQRVPLVAEAEKFANGVRTIFVGIGSMVYVLAKPGIERIISVVEPIIKDFL